MRKFPFILLITGASGCGKTTVTKALEKDPFFKDAIVCYFDDIGVPSPHEMILRHGTGHKWQEWASHSWIEKMLAHPNKMLLVLEGSFYPRFPFNKLKKHQIENCLIVCLHVERSVREQRLRQERGQPELITQEMENYAQVLKKETEELGGVIIDCTRKSVSGVVKEISSLVAKKIQLFSNLS